jgi:arylsulfatase
MRGKIVLPAILILVAAAVLAAFLVPITVGGREAPAKPGSPAYTESLLSKALPPLPPKFGGEIKQTAALSKP